MGNAVPVGDLTGLMRHVGFEHIEFAGKTGIITSKFSEGAHFRASKPEQRVIVR